MVKTMKFQHIVNLRHDKDLSQKIVATYLGVAQNTYSQYETGVIAFTDDILLKLARLYGVSVDYLLDLTDEKKPYKTKH